MVPSWVNRRRNRPCRTTLDTGAPFFDDELRMDDVRLSRSYLETLSTEDLSLMADRLGLELPANLNRNFVIEELLDGISEATTPGPPDLDEAVPEDDGQKIAAGLPGAYNRTYLEVLLRDPIWAFTFWEVRKADRDLYEGAADFGGYRLRVNTLGASVNPGDGSFFIAVEPDDSAWYLCVPSQTGNFRVDLCAVKGKKEVVLASSQPFRVPACRPVPSAAEDALLPVLLLSGLDEFRVIRSVDRTSHLPQRCEY